MTAFATELSEENISWAGELSAARVSVEFSERTRATRSLDRCICGGPKRSGRLCSTCFQSAPDYILEGYLRGNRAQLKVAERWLMAYGESRRVGERKSKRRLIAIL